MHKNRLAPTLKIPSNCCTRCKIPPPTKKGTGKCENLYTIFFFPCYFFFIPLFLLYTVAVEDDDNDDDDNDDDD